MIIYKLQNKINGNVYIGQTIKSINHRVCQHIVFANRGSNMKICQAIKKYGIHNFNISIVCECDSKEDMNAKEIHYIELYNSYRNGYNGTPGGDSRGEVSESTRRKLSELNIGKKMSIESRKKMSESKIKLLSEKDIGNFKTRRDIKTESILSLLNNGYTLQRAADILGCSDTLIFKRIKKLYPERKFEKTIRREIKTEDIIALRKQGYSMMKIAELFCCSFSLVQSRLSKTTKVLKVVGA